MSQARILFSTIDTLPEAEKIAHQLVSEKIAACVSILPNVTSVYKWEGKVEKAAEYLLLIKTSEQQLDLLISRLIEIHPYEVPEAIVLEIERGHPPYLDWILRETAG